MGCVLATGCLPPPSTWTGRSPHANKVETLRDRYELGEVLGKGRTGVVHAGTCRKSGSQVAVKMIDHAETPVDRIKNDVDMLKSLSHSNIVQFYGMFIDDVHVSIVMNRLSGGDLISGLALRDGKVTPRQTIHVSRQVALAIQHLHHTGIMHRDIKGDNFLLDRSDITDEKCHIALCDFDTATSVKPGQRFRSAVGTKAYWSAEVYEQNYGIKADIFAMGVLNYGLITGRFPFNTETQVRHKNVRLPNNADAACLSYVRSMLEKDENTRADIDAVASHDWTSGDWDTIESYEDKVCNLEEAESNGILSLATGAGARLLNEKQSELSSKTSWNGSGPTRPIPEQRGSNISIISHASTAVSLCDLSAQGYGQRPPSITSLDSGSRSRPSLTSLDSGSRSDLLECHSSMTSSPASLTNSQKARGFVAKQCFTRAKAGFGELSSKLSPRLVARACKKGLTRSAHSLPAGQ